MYKIFLTLLALSLCACGESNGNSPTPKDKVVIIENGTTKVEHGTYLIKDDNTLIVRGNLVIK